MNFIKETFQNIPYSIRVVILIVILGFVLYVFFQYFVKRLISKIKFLIKETVVPLEMIYKPIRFLLPSLILLIIIPFITIPTKIRLFINHILVIWLIIGVAWLVISIIAILKAVILGRYNIKTKDNLKVRQITTQLNIIQRILIVLIVILTISAILMTFDKVRQIGVSILASAGVAGIVVGFAAQRSLANLIAGIQIAITQPIRIGDVVIVENEWGTIEEITLTYVVVQIWDQRRLVVPINYFLEHSFQNWTKSSAELIGAIFIYVDYGIPVDELRRELEKIVDASPLWDKRVAKIQVTNATEKTMEIRALVSAENSSKTWELRCLVREKLIDFIQQNYPDKLPRLRLETDKNTDVKN
ncbi:MAG TPA: mechanosensitive ion channel [Candidatus Marinimicrobia bacterium]|nr:mechanosensitive ion channel [Candidatus Neomarinimicrobiota bacterium]